MTKLTPQEIEQERVKFEKWFEMKYFSKLCSISEQWEKNRNRYKHNSINASYQSWIARAELAKGD